ncbi:MAG TPA: hypothetical protein VHX49_17315 [Candidatus Acidoferrales bacterium]|nr:hypothetical protein [Candidatus Acidoferrales bacterium]
MDDKTFVDTNVLIYAHDIAQASASRIHLLAHADAALNYRCERSGGC